MRATTLVTYPVNNWLVLTGGGGRGGERGERGGGRVSTEVTFWHSAEYGSDFRCNSGELPRNSAEFRGISPELRRNHFRSQKIPRNSVSAEFRGHPRWRVNER
jgi:hypothetical protein